MRATGLTVLLLLGCPARRETAPTPDAGPRAVTVFLGQPVTTSQGDVWPRDAQRTLSMHELKGPLELTVVLPSGRRWQTRAPKALGKTDDHHWPTKNEPPETRVPSVESLHVPLGEFPTWAQALDASLKLAADLGVERRFIEEMDAKIRTKPVPYPTYPLEGCVTLTTGLQKRGTDFALEAQLYLSTPGSYRLEGWPDTCSADAGAR